MHKSAFVDVNNIAVAAVGNKVAPWHFVHLARKRQVVVPAERLCPVDSVNMAAARAVAEVDEGVMVDILVAKLAETVAAGLML